MPGQLKTVSVTIAKAMIAPNWSPVTVNLWANLQADIKLPVLLLIAFLLGWLPTWLIMRARVWTFRRRFEALERQHASPPTAQAVPVAEEEAPAE